ncbi:hypothetical protein DPEC_G00057330 [Dallia pectoralis]|uniref:Uncharacterized protein n=1 Tax=Dallia pectoralis TaxID=75939 RepID=A0ACC2H5Z4_DALPE|nr:hypothetical protein DPEC_G00057330 [Dallia pectoralis]
MTLISHCATLFSQTTPTESRLLSLPGWDGKRVTCGEVGGETGLNRVGTPPPAVGLAVGPSKTPLTGKVGTEEASETPQNKRGGSQSTAEWNQTCC